MDWNQEYTWLYQWKRLGLMVSQCVFHFLLRLILLCYPPSCHFQTEMLFSKEISNQGAHSLEILKEAQRYPLLYKEHIFLVMKQIYELGYSTFSISINTNHIMVVLFIMLSFESPEFNRVEQS